MNIDKILTSLAPITNRMLKTAYQQGFEDGQKQNEKEEIEKRDAYYEKERQQERQQEETAFDNYEPDFDAIAKDEKATKEESTKLVCGECEREYDEEPRVEAGMKCGRCSYAE